jgi:hypothetical protein
MRAIAVVILAACGGPALQNAPRPDPAAVAGVAAAAAAAATLADPNKPQPEKKIDENKREVEVKEQVPSGVLDRLDSQPAPATPAAATPDPKPDPKKKKGAPPPKIPSPKDFVDKKEAGE